jgi:hypothetical protein
MGNQVSTGQVEFVANSYPPLTTRRNQIGTDRVE